MDAEADELGDLCFSQKLVGTSTCHVTPIHASIIVLVTIQP